MQCLCNRFGRIVRATHLHWLETEALLVLLLRRTGKNKCFIFFVGLLFMFGSSWIFFATIYFLIKCKSILWGLLFFFFWQYPVFCVLFFINSNEFSAKDPLRPKLVCFVCLGPLCGACSKTHTKKKK